MTSFQTRKEAEQFAAELSGWDDMRIERDPEPDEFSATGHRWVVTARDPISLRVATWLADSPEPTTF